MMRSKEKREEGYVIVTVAVLGVVLIGFAALAVDMGALYGSRTTAQKIADAAAIAGVSSFVFNPIAPQPGTARQYAENTAVGQEILAEPVQLAEVTAIVDVANRRVTVDISRVEDTYLAGVLGIDQATVQVRAVAEASATALGSSCVKPWFLPNTVLLPPRSEACNTCDPSSPDFDPVLAEQVLVKNGAITTFAQGQLGSQFVVKPQTPSQSLAPGNFYAMQLGNGPGGDVYRENIEICAPAIFCGDCYTVETGNMVGPTIQGVDYLIGDPPEDDYFDVGDYGSDHSDTSRALIAVPIWDICSAPGDGCTTEALCPDGKMTGTNIMLRIIGFASIFLEGAQGPNITARLIGVGACGGGGIGGGDPGETGVLGFPIRLVRSDVP